jgi:hypothetical protein
MVREPTTTSGAAADLGLLAEKLSIEAYTEKLGALFLQGCSTYGVRQTARIFADQARRATKLKPKQPKPQNPAPPRKQKGAHNPEDDKLLLQLWHACRLGNPQLTKKAFSEFAAKNHNQPVAAESLVKHLTRLLAKDKR